MGNASCEHKKQAITLATAKVYSISTLAARCNGVRPPRTGIQEGSRGFPKQQAELPDSLGIIETFAAKIKTADSGELKSAVNRPCGVITGF